MNIKGETIGLITLDMAGTTIKDNHEVEMCFKEAAVQTHLKMSEEEILAVQGWSKRFVFEEFWERQIGERNYEWHEKVENSYEIFRGILENHYLTADIEPTDGCLELFSFLKEQNIPIALTTGFYRKVTNIILSKLGWLEGLNEKYTGNHNSIIQASIASDEVAKGRPEPYMIQKAMNLLHISNSKNVINIGDTPSDILSGANAGCLYSCSVTNGTHSAKQLEPYPAAMHFSSLSDFRLWLASFNEM